MDWTGNMQGTALEALAKLRDLSLSEARKLIQSLKEAGVSLTSENGSLKARGTPLTAQRMPQRIFPRHH